MPINYDPKFILELKAIEDKSLKKFILSILKNGSFLKKKEHIKEGIYKTELQIGYTIYFELDGSEVIVLGIH